MTEVTVGIDIGTSSVKAIAADGDGEVVARTRIPHAWAAPTPGRFEHDATVAWRDGPAEAWRAMSDFDVRGVCVSAMVPSVAAVDDAGRALTSGLLYGDERGRDESGAVELSGMVRWAASQAPTAHGLWPAQALAAATLGGEAVIDTTVAAGAMDLCDLANWNDEAVTAIGARVEQLPRIVGTGQAAGTVTGANAVLASECIDAFAEQLVAGAADVGDVHVLLGTTVIVWVVLEPPAEVPGVFTIPHSATGRLLAGGPSDAGGLFVSWATGMLEAGARDVLPDDPGRVPVWLPYPRGERVGMHAIERRAELADLDLTHDARSVARAAYEGTGFAVRRVIDAAHAATGNEARRVVMTGGGTLVDPWVQAVADATALPVDCALVPEGAALGAAWLARIAAGLEEPTAMSEGRWARTGRVVEPDPRWVGPVRDRYERFVALAGRPDPAAA